MEIRVLGPMEVVQDGSVVPVAGKPAALLALLVVAHPRGVTADSIIDAVWPSMSRGRALNNMRVNLSKVRDLLPDRDDLAFDGGRYHLRIGVEDVDANRFRAIAGDARAALAAGNVRLATTEFRRALDEWRGLAFDDVFDLADIDRERNRLDQLRLDALRDGATTLLSDDRPDEAVRLLQPEWETDRAMESIAEPLVLALMRCRRSLDALATFRATRDALRDEHGMDPSAEFCELEYEILEPAPAPELSRRTPRAVRFRRPSTFIGRDRELAELRATWDQATAGTPRLALVSGPAGIGKSALLDAFARDVSRGGASVLVGTCVQDPSTPYVPFAELVRSALAESPTDTPPALLSELSHLTPELADRLPPSRPARDPNAGRLRLFEAVASVLTRHTGPRLVVFDDMQWARPDAVDLFRQVLRGATGQSMILVGYRATATIGATPFGRSMDHGRLHDPDLHLSVPRMNRHELVALIDDVAPSERRLGYQHAIDELEDVSAGNPLFLCEAIRQLEIEPDRPIAEVVPASVRALVDRRLGRLAPVEQRVVRVASVIGRVFSPSMVATTAGLTEDDVLDALDIAIANGLVLEGPGPEEFTFAHPLMRTGIYQGQVHARRVRTHVRVAEALAARPDPTGAHVPGIARHLLSARPVSDARRTWDAALAAGDDALARFAHDSAATWYEAALDCEDASFDDIARAELRLRLGLALDRCSRVDEARRRFFEAADIARATDDVALLVRTVEAATPREAVLDADYAAQLAPIVHDALSVADLDVRARVSMLYSAVFVHYYTDPHRLRDLFEAAERAAGDSTDPVTRNRIVSMRSLLTDRDDDLGRLDLARESYAICARAGLEIERGRAVRRYLSELLVCGYTEEFDAALDELTVTAETYRIPSDHHYSLALRAVRSLMRAPDADAETHIEAARLVGVQAGYPWADGLYRLQMFALGYQRGTVSEVAAFFPPATGRDPRIGAGLALHAIAAATAGDLDTARAVLDLVVDDDTIALRPDNFWLGATALFADVAATCGTAAQRQVLRAALTPRADRCCVFGTGGALFGTGHHWLARLDVADGDVGGAREHLARAVDLCQDADARFWAERAREQAAGLRVE